MSQIAFVGALIAFFFADSIYAASPVPTCRLDNSLSKEVKETVERAVASYAALGRRIPFSRVEVNPSVHTPSASKLTVWVVRDASKDAVDASGCAGRAEIGHAELDDRSVRGGCVVAAIDTPEIRCSADAVRLFADRGNGRAQPNPALLYVLAHELAHLLQRRSGEYAGRAVVLTVAQDQASRLQVLQKNCDPTSTKREEEADALAFSVLSKVLPMAPYREPTLSARGSLLWNTDRLALASDAWQRAMAVREFVSAPKVHKAFEPEAFPTPSEKIKANAAQFVCDALQSKDKSVSFPALSPTHPPVEQRLQKIVEALAPVAKQLPNAGGATGYEPIARLQQDLGDVFSHIYRETGVYVEAVHKNVCFIVNGESPTRGCADRR